jgi:hypothetical protein
MMHRNKKYARFSIPYSRHHEKQQECLHDDYDRHRLQYDEQPSESGREIFSYSVFHALRVSFVDTWIRDVNSDEIIDFQPF